MKKIEVGLPKTSQPAARALESVGITKLRQLTARTEKEIADLHGMGPKTLGILKKALAKQKLSFKKNNKK